MKVIFVFGGKEIMVTFVIEGKNIGKFYCRKKTVEGHVCNASKKEIK